MGLVMTAPLASALLLLGDFHHRGSGLVDESVENSGGDQALPAFAGLLDGAVLDLDEHFAGDVHAAKQPVSERLLAGAGPVLIEHGFPRVVVADVDARQYERHVQLLWMTR